MSNQDASRSSTIGALRRWNTMLIVGCNHCGIEFRLDPRAVAIHGRTRVSEVYHRFRCQKCGRPAGYTQAEAAPVISQMEPAP